MANNNHNVKQNGNAMRISKCTVPEESVHTKVIK